MSELEANVTAACLCGRTRHMPGVTIATAWETLDREGWGTGPKGKRVCPDYPACMAEAAPPVGGPGVEHAIVSLARAVRRETDRARRELPASSPDDIATCRRTAADLARQALELSRVVEVAWWAKVPSPADRREQRDQGP